MGRAEVDGTVRYVSPVTARLFSKMGSEILGLSTGEFLAPMEGVANWLDQQHQHPGPTPPIEPGGYSVGAGAMGAAAAVSSPGGAGAGGAMARQRHVEVVRPCPTSPTTSGAVCPQDYLESILAERGYDYSTRSSASGGCICEPTQKQMDDYQVPLVEAVRRWDLRTLEALAANGVDMGASNRFGESVVHLATRRGSAPVVQFLLMHGGSLRICDDYGKTPLHDAFWTSEPRFDLVSMMLDLDWSLLRATDVRGATPLRYAKKRHWGLWCEFLDRVKDKHWPHLPPGMREVEGNGSDSGGVSPAPMEAW